MMKTAGRRILLVEDDEAIASIVMDLLGQNGFEAVHCDRMDTALEHFRATSFDLVITDFHIQQGSGRRLLNEIRKSEGTLPVFLMTGTPFVTENDFANLRFDKVFMKPFEFDDLIANVKKACARSS